MAEVITRFKADTSQYDRKIKDAKRSLDGLGKSCSGIKGSFQNLASSLGVNVGAMTKFAGAAGAAAAALKVAKDAFMSCESNIDEWGRTVEGAKGAYKSLLDTLNGGNWSNFFSNLGKAIQDSRDLYDSLDRLGSIKANNAAAIAIKEAAMKNLLLRKQNGEDVNAEIKALAAEITALKGQAVSQGKDAGRKTITNSISSYARGIDGGAMFDSGSLNGAVDNLINKGQEAFDYYAKQYETLKKMGTTTVTTTYYDQFGTHTGTTSQFDINKLTAGQQAMYKLSAAITENEATISQGIALIAEAATAEAAASQAQYAANKRAASGGGSASSAKEEVQLGRLGMLRAQASALKASENSSVNTAEDYQALADALADVNREIDQIINKSGDLKEALSLEVPAVSAEKMLQNVHVLGEEGKVVDMAWTEAVGAIGQLGSALQSIDDPAAKVMGIIAQAVANIALTFSKALAGDTLNTWEWIAAAASGTATMISTITAIKSVVSGSYANGGIVGGNSFSGDNLTANVNSGELILNKAQQASIARQLSGTADSRVVNVVGRISGRDILLAADNENRSRGGSRGAYANVR